MSSSTPDHDLDSPENKEAIQSHLSAVFVSPDLTAGQTLDQFNWPATQHLDGADAAEEPALNDLGVLEVFSNELIYNIVGFLDLPTVNNLRAANRAALQIVENHPMWVKMKQHAGDILRATVHLQVKKPSMSDFFAALHSTKCFSCGQFGGLLYLMTAKRVCRYCLEFDKDWPLTSTHTQRLLGQSESDVLSNLPVQKMPRGVWGPFHLLGPLVMPTWLVDRAAVASILGMRQLDTQGLRFDTVLGLWATIIPAPFLVESVEAPLAGQHCSLCQAWVPLVAVYELQQQLLHRQHDPREFAAHVRADHPSEYWQAVTDLFPWTERPDGE